MKIGVPVFGYGGFKKFAAQFVAHGHFTVNLGDNMQSIAIRMLLSRLGIADEDTVSIDRDDMGAYAGPPVALIMNGVFPARCFPLPARIKPIYIGLCVTENTVVSHRNSFLGQPPIGCRDVATAAIFEKHGIQAFVSGCLTMTIPERTQTLAGGARKVLIVYGSGDGAFPSSALRNMSSRLLQDSEFVSQRIPVFEHPLGAQCRQQMERYAASLLDYYAHNASLIVTSLHHAAAPCMGLGIPTIICRQQADSRFTYLSNITTVHTSEDLHEIDWDPGPTDITSIRGELEQVLLERILAL